MQQRFRRCAVLVGVVASLWIGPLGFAQARDTGFRLTAVATACQERPTIGPFANGGCVSVPGVMITVADEGGRVIASCVTETVAPTPPVTSCSVKVPFGIVVIVTADVSAFPKGYALDSPNPQVVPIPAGPPQGEFGGPVFLALPIADAIATEPPPAGSPQVPQETPPPTTGRPAHVHRRACTHLRRTPRYDLTGLTVPNAPHEGAEGATVAEASYSVIAVSLEQVLAVEHAIHVHQSRGQMGISVACGEIGGPRRADGSVIIGLREQHDSGLSGIAYLAPDPADPGRTQVSLFLAAGLAEEQAPPAATPATG